MSDHDRCKAVLFIKGADYRCDEKADHKGMAHSSREAEALWASHQEAEWMHLIDWAAGVVDVPRD